MKTYMVIYRNNDCQKVEAENHGEAAIKAVKPGQTISDILIIKEIDDGH